MTVFVNELRPNTSVGAQPPVSSTWLYTSEELALMTVGELRAICDKHGIKATSKARKADLIALIESAGLCGGDST